MDIPSAVPVAKAEPLAQQQAQVQVPPGVGGGQLMTVQLNGQMLQVQVPAGAGPGDTFAVAAPNAAAVAAPVHATPVPMSSGMNDAMYARELQRQEMGAAVMPGAMGAGVEHLTPAEQLVLNYQHSIKCFAMIDIFFTVLRAITVSYLYIIVLIGPVCGYIGSQRLHRPKLGVYLCFCVIEVFQSVYSALRPGSSVIWALLYLIVKMWITSFVYKFWRVLGLVDTTRLEVLMDPRYRGNVRFVYY